MSYSVNSDITPLEWHELKDSNLNQRFWRPQCYQLHQARIFNLKVGQLHILIGFHIWPTCICYQCLWRRQRDSNPQRLLTPTVFKTASSSCRIICIKCLSYGRAYEPDGLLWLGSTNYHIPLARVGATG